LNERKHGRTKCKVRSKKERKKERLICESRRKEGRKERRKGGVKKTRVIRDCPNHSCLNKRGCWSQRRKKKVTNERTKQLKRKEPFGTVERSIRLEIPAHHATCTPAASCLDNTHVQKTRKGKRGKEAEDRQAFLFACCRNITTSGRK